MATILAYTSPALGHLFPISALLAELRGRGHTIALRTLAEGVATGRELGFTTAAIDPRIEAIVHDDWTAPNPRAALRRAFAVFARRAVHEVNDLRTAIADVRPDALIIDATCWGAASAADAGDLPWASFCPFTPFLTSRGVPPFGPGLRPWPGVLGRIRDGALRPLLTGVLNRSVLGPLNQVRAQAGVAPVGSFDEFLLRPPLNLVAGGEPFEYHHPDWGDAIQMIGPCCFDPAPAAVPEWLNTIDRPIVVVSTSSERQGDTKLAVTTMAALADDPVHVVATIPAGAPDGATVPPNATVRDFVPHSVVLDRAICAVTHGGMGATQKALARGVPVCVVPFGRDQFEVARRVEVAACGTRLPAKKLTVGRLRDRIHQSMSMTEGARRVAEGFIATGGIPRGADLIEHRLLQRTNHPGPVR
ncbi:MAG: glycosyltransferase, family [Mycobacterium sp.]|jgi:MGT family glycosyltransferase|nr:glycosyltransferase, family [Mycobacterium sp.]